MCGIKVSNKHSLAYSKSNVTSCLVTDQSECPEPPLASRQQ